MQLSKLTVAIIWVLWGLLAFLAFCWLLFAILQFFGQLSKAADWVQAFGSVVAILAAAGLPVWHDILRSKKEQQRLRKLLVMNSKFQVQYISLLYRTLYEAVHDFGDPSINRYLANGHHQKLRAHMDGLACLPMANLSPWEFRSLGNLKAGASYAMEVADSLKDVDVTSHKYRNDVRLLKHHMEMAQIIHQQFVSNIEFAD